MSKYIEKVEQYSIPVIPMRGIVAFPGAPINFELERDISKEALNKAHSSDMIVLLLTQKDISCENPSENDLYSIGCVARIKQSLKRPHSDNIRVVAEGLCRATVQRIENRGSYLSADVLAKTILADFSTLGIRTEALVLEARETLSKMLTYIPSLTSEFYTTAMSIENPGLLCDFIASNTFVRYQDKYAVLEQFDFKKRLELTIILMEKEMQLLKTEMEIQSKVKEAIDEHQRDFYLREQLKVIEGELGVTEDSDEMREKMAKVKLPEEVREKLEKEVLKLEKTPVGSPEAAVIRNYIEVCLDIPWGKLSKDRIELDTAKKILDGDHDGLEKVKSRIIEFLAVKKLNPELKNQILCLVGPPGVGKTSLGASIAHAMKRKYVRVSLGGIRDESDIRGHRKTYIGSMPGRIITALTQAGTLNPVMLLDEVDKMCASVQGDPASALLEVLDSEQNKSFRDHFIELPVDLSETMFIATANTLDTIPRPLLDRMEVIELGTYTPSEKLSIAKNHLVPKQLSRHGLTKRQVKLTDGVIEEVISGYTRESGVRNLERELASLFRKCARRIVEEEIKSVTLKKTDIEGYLGPRKVIDDVLDKRDLVGVANGLAYTEVGGDVLKVESLPVDGVGKIELTGTLGDVMKESAHIAVTYIRSHAVEFGIPTDFYKTKDIHIHVPEGATPKDGPSAGVTMTTSLVSALSGIPVRHDVAMTGEITLTGRVLAIGGLKEKSTAAYSLGIRTILIPKDNMRDIAELDKIVRDEVTFIPCETLDDVLSVALRRPIKENSLPAVECADGIEEKKEDKKLVYPTSGERAYTTL